MRILTILFCVFAFSKAFATPLWEEDRHFIHYKALVMEGDLMEIDRLVDDLREKYGDDESLKAIRLHSKMIMVNIVGEDYNP